MADFDLTMYDKQAIRAIEGTLEQGILNLAVNITAQAKDLCPVADYMGGNLKGSIQWKTDKGQSGGDTSSTALTEQPPKDGAVVGTPVEYGVYQEFGTRKMNAQPFLRPAVDIQAGGKNLQEAMYRAFFDTVPRELKKA
jgi:HK97 gp10 family phage protein